MTKRNESQCEIDQVGSTDEVCRQSNIDERNESQCEINQVESTSDVKKFPELANAMNRNAKSIKLSQLMKSENIKRYRNATSCKAKPIKLDQQKHSKLYKCNELQCKLSTWDSFSRNTATKYTRSVKALQTLQLCIREASRNPVSNKCKNSYKATLLFSKVYANAATVNKRRGLYLTIT